MIKRIALLLVALLFGTAFADEHANSLVIGSSQEPVVVASDVFNVVTNTVTAVEHEGYMMGGLYRMNIDTVLEPMFATEVATVENGRMRIFDSPTHPGQQAIELHLTLREGLKWSDGEPLDTDDFLFTYEMAKEPGMPLLSPDYWERFSMKVVDPLNMVITLDFGQRSDLLGSPIAAQPRHIMGQRWEATRAAAAATDDPNRKREIFSAYFTEFGSPAAVNSGRMAYSGPFMPVRWTAGSAMEMVRNPNYYDHPENQENYVQRVEYRYLNDTNALLFSIMSGAVDVTSATSITFDQGVSPQLLSRDGERYDIWFVLQPTWEHIELNQFTGVQEAEDLMLRDVRTRRALTMAIDRQGMTDALFSGAQPVAHSNVPSPDPNFTPDVMQFPYDPEGAAALFAELGWTKGADGILTRTDASGRTIRFEIEFVTTAGNAVRERQQQFIAEDLRRVGVATRINNAPANVVFGNDFINGASTGTWTGMFMFAYSSSQAAVLNGATYLCRNAPSAANDFTGQNVANACSPEYDEAREAAVKILDPVEALPYYHRMQEIFAEEVMAISLIYRSQPYVSATGLNNYVTSTYATGAGYPPARPELVGWESHGAVKVFDWADYARRAR